MAYQPAGAFKAIPAYATAALAITVALPTVIGLRKTTRPISIFADGGASTLLGIALSLAVNRLMRSVGLAWQGVQLIPRPHGNGRSRRPGRWQAARSHRCSVRIG